MKKNNDHMELQLSAYLDGELSSAEKSRMEDEIGKNPALQQKLKELQFLRSLTRNVKPSVEPDVNPDFFWSQLRQQIEASQSRKTEAIRRQSHAFPIWGWALSGVAACLMLMMVLLRQDQSDPMAISQNINVAQVESLSTELPDTRTLAYQNEESTVAVIWIFGLADEDNQVPGEEIKTL